ncbi:MAG: type II 3-dehydroquinate dehydratase [Gammaproteobacteria bacterium]|nr:MAG: type II 3-dehydroquinate dehydratase [Gammaproteobacteria bacterium]
MPDPRKSQQEVPKYRRIRLHSRGFSGPKDSRSRELGHELLAFQSNAEHELIQRIQRAPADAVAFIIINPGALTHTSIALRDALAGAALPFIEVHLSNIFAREPFRRHSYVSDLAVGVITGLGACGYEAAVRAAAARLARSP